MKTSRIAEYADGFAKPISELKGFASLECPTCHKDFSGYDLAVLEHCERCKKLVPFLLSE